MNKYSQEYIIDNGTEYENTVSRLPAFPDSVDFYIPLIINMNSSLYGNAVMNENSGRQVCTMTMFRFNYTPKCAIFRFAGVTNGTTNLDGSIGSRHIYSFIIGFIF